MNLLAHAVLSPDVEKTRIGNVLADFIARSEKACLDEEIQKGIEIHQKIDHFTDNHPAVRRSYDKLVGFQRYANPLIDVFYDHFLVMSWPKGPTVGEYVGELYRSIRRVQPLLPNDCVTISDRMMEQDWLNQYGTYSGLETNLTRMQSRIEWATGRKVDLVSSLQILETKYFEFEKDFLEFWPLLKKASEEWCE